MEFSAPIYATCAEGRGRIIGFVPRGRNKKIVAIVLIKRKCYDIPLSELKNVKTHK